MARASIASRGEAVKSQAFFEQAKITPYDYMFYTYENFKQYHRRVPMAPEITAQDVVPTKGTIGDLIQELTSFENTQAMSIGDLKKMTIKDLSQNFKGFGEKNPKGLKGQDLLEILQVGTTIEKAAEQTANKMLKAALENKKISVKNVGSARVELDPSFQYDNYKGTKITKRTSLTDVILEIEKEGGELETLNVSIKWFGKTGKAAAKSLGIVNPIQVIQVYSGDQNNLKALTNCIALSQREEEASSDMILYDAYFAAKLIKDVTFGGLFGSDNQKIGLFLSQRGFMKASTFAQLLNNQKEKLRWTPFSGLNALSKKLGNYSVQPKDNIPIDPDRINRANATWARFIGSDGWRLYIQ